MFVPIYGIIKTRNLNVIWSIMTNVSREVSLIHSLVQFKTDPASFIITYILLTNMTTYIIYRT